MSALLDSYQQQVKRLEERVTKLEREIHDERNKAFIAQLNHTNELQQERSRTRHFEDRLGAMKDLVEEMDAADLVEAGFCPAHFEPMTACDFCVTCDSHDHNSNCEVYWEIRKEERRRRADMEREAGVR